MVVILHFLTVNKERLSHNLDKKNLLKISQKKRENNKFV